MKRIAPLLIALIAPTATLAQDPHAHHHGASQSAGPSAPPPPVPTDHAADTIFPADRMAEARHILLHEHGHMDWPLTRLEYAEVRPGSTDVYAWEGMTSYGGDLNRFVLRTEGEATKHELETAEVRALASRAIGPYFNAEAGVRQDLGHGPDRTWATVGVEGLAPYWFEVSAAGFLSTRGDVAARLEAAYDLRLTQKLILEPRAELNLISSEPTVAEAGLRLRYEIRREFAPFVGVTWEHAKGRSDVRAAFGLRGWF